MAHFSVHEAKTNLSKLIAAALEGGDVVIARGSVPVVRLVPLFRSGNGVLVPSREGLRWIRALMNRSQTMSCAAGISIEFTARHPCAHLVASGGRIIESSGAGRHERCEQYHRR